MTAKRLKSNTEDGYTFFIEPDGDGYRLTVEPAFRRNGTQSLDGWLPRFYTKARFAKAALTKFQGKPVRWEEESHDIRRINLET